jgi:acetylornithine deacetylase/succinyl-diaminopimelate desuccinylase family protein
MSDVVDLLARLVAIDSVNPAYGGPGEAEVARLVESFFRTRGLETFTQPVHAGRENVVAVLPGRDRSRRIVLEAHMDTVSAEGMTTAPFQPVVRDGRLHGRGACDVKAGLAAMMQAVADLHVAGTVPPYDVWLAAVVDEEHAFTGVLALVDGLEAAGAVVAEPTSLRIVTATKGVLRFRIEVTGRAAHSSQPHLGASAISTAARLVLALDAAHAALASVAHPLLGTATGSVGTIAGGVQINIVPAACTLAVDRRLLPGESPASVLADYRRLVARTLADAGDEGVTALVDEPLLVDDALETASTATVVQAASAAAEALRLDPTPRGVPYGSDASKFARAGVPAIVFGPGSIDCAHAADEWVPVAEVEQAVSFYRELVLRWG